MKANDHYGQFNGPAEVRILRTLPGPIERIWDYLTDSEKRSRWFAGGPMELRQGGKVVLRFKHKELVPEEEPPEQHKDGHSMEGIITRFEPPHVLAFTFGSTGESEAIFELTTQGKNVLLVLTHRARGEDIEYMPDFGAGWHTHVRLLIALLEGGPRPLFWAPFGQLKTDYARLQTEAQKP